ncbi:MAG TPA: methyltransferase domain-containing protein [Caulobacteraceae bacterium]|nr:methyltransferase domain-containing protein [Caulobacteraceae bacterium]
MPPSPFAGAARYYRFRAPYAAAALDFVRDAFALGPGHRVLDLGCGPGTLSAPLARWAGEVVAVDPDSGMLAQARRDARAAGANNLRFVQARAEDAAARLGRFRLTVMGQSFHWMDRDRVLADLAAAIEPGGGLALINPGPRRPQESWEGAADTLVEAYLGPIGRHPAMNTEPRHQGALLRSSAFRDFSEHEFATVVERDFDSVLGCVYSRSFSRRRLFGARAPQFESELRAAFDRLAPRGRLVETVETEVLIAPKRAA